MRTKFRLSLLLSASALLFFSSCQKQGKELPAEPVDEAVVAQRHNGHSSPTKAFSPEVVIKWLNVQLDMLRVPLPAGTGSQGADRAVAYCGIALYETVVPGMSDYQSLKGQLTAFPAMPSILKGKSYHWAAAANATLAEMNRKLFPTTAPANLARVDSLENALKEEFACDVDEYTLARSIAFGKEVATRVFNWASTDGSANVNPPYVPPVGPGLWVPTPPNFPAAVNPYASQRRLLVPGVKNGTALAPPPPYSTNPNSAFYKMVKDVYDKSQVLTPDQIAMALYHRDAPGYPAGGHFVAILSQVLSISNARLDKATLCYVKMGLAIHDAGLVCFTYKYTYNQVRPITYIRDVMGYTTWSALFNTPGHPEFPGAHSTNSAAVAYVLTDELGDHFKFTLHSYDYLGLPARTYKSFSAMAKEMSNSRVFGGIHYQASCDKGAWLGEKVSRNILRKIDFLKKGGHGHDHDHSHH